MTKQNNVDREIAIPMIQKFLGSDDVELTIEFEKKNGEMRLMRCTTNLDNVPLDQHPKGDGNKKRNPDVQAVFDLDKNAWRSFHWDSLRSYTIKNKDSKEEETVGIKTQEKEVDHKEAK